jgi:hypothetical protein
MSDPMENIDKILSDAANRSDIPVPVAQLLMRVAVELSRQYERIAVLREEATKYHELSDRRHQDLQRQIDRLKRVHGA